MRGNIHERNDVQSVQHSHYPRPPPVLMDRTVVAPLPNRPRGPLLRAFRRPLSLDELLKVDPFSLWLGEQRRTRLGREVPDNNTDSTDQHVDHSGTAESDSPDEKREDDDTAHQVVGEE